jgi:hypothetical protein
MKKYRFKTTVLLLLGAALVMFAACNRDDDEKKTGTIIDETYKPVSVTPVSGLRIAWDYSTLTRLTDKGVAPEMIRFSENSLVAVYEHEDRIYLTGSEDNGQTWGNAFTLFDKGSHTGKNNADDVTYEELMTQPTIIRMNSGDLLAACAVKYKYRVNDTDTQFPAAIKVRRINGTTFEPEQSKDVYVNLGVESPSLMMLPDGKVQLYFVNCAIQKSIAMINSTEMSVDLREQQIVVIESEDEGQTWTSLIEEIGPDGVDRSWIGARDVASRAYRNNLYPAPALIDGQIIVAVADNRTMTYKPYIVRSPLSANWSKAVRGDTPDREYALYELLPDKYFMSDPDLLVLPAGDVLLSYETDEGRNTGFELMEVAVGSADAYNFKYRTRPFPFAANEKAVNNSLMLFDDSTALALTASNRGFSTDEDMAPWYIKGHLLNDLTVTGSEIDSYPIFVGGRTEANIKAGLGVDAGNLYVGVKAKDATSVTATAGTQHGDGVYLYIDAANLSLLDVDAGISKFWVSSTGEVARWDGNEGRWTAVSSSGITATAVEETDGYTLNVTIPRSTLTNFNSQGIRFAIGLTDYTDEETGITELLSLCQDLRSASWLGITF